MMRFSARKITVAFLAAMTFAAILPAYGRKSRASSYDREAEVRKADYIFLEAKRQGLGKNMDAYYDMVDYAFRLNPEEKLFGMELGIYYAHLDTLNPTRGVDLMADYVENTPDDLYNAYAYAQFCERTGRTDNALHAWELMHTRFPERLPITERYANALRDTGDSLKMNRALELYDTMEIHGADPMSLTASRATVYFMRNDSAGVRNQVLRLLESDPTSVPYNIFVGQIYQNVFKSDSALNYFDRAIELDPENGYAYYLRANFFNARNDSVAFDHEVFEALRKNDLDVEVKLAMMRDYVVKLYSDTTQRPRIVELFDIMCEQNPHQPDVRGLYSDYLSATGDYTGAAEQLSVSLDLEPDNPRAWKALSSLYLTAEEYAKSHDAAVRGLHYFPGDGELTQLEVTALTMGDRLDEAMAAVDSAIVAADSLNGDYLSELYSMKGDIYYKEKKIDEAMAAYDRAISENPLNYMAMNNAAYYLACEGQDLDRALSLAEKAMSGRPSNTVADTYAWVLFKRKDYAKAMDVINKVLETEDDPSSDIFEHAGDIYFMNARPDEAIEFWEKALKLDPDNELLKRKVTHRTYFFK